MRARLASVAIGILALVGARPAPSYAQDSVDQVFAFETDRRQAVARSKDKWRGLNVGRQRPEDDLERVIEEQLIQIGHDLVIAVQIEP